MKTEAATNGNRSEIKKIELLKILRFRIFMEKKRMVKINIIIGPLLLSMKRAPKTKSIKIVFMMPEDLFDENVWYNKKRLKNIGKSRFVI
ncbi:hypothetical protein [Draconibacterium mangrovi]|uniref:hypothetical protein n=1 Tax=Draconibacterium mangrovi TaxID=2697469 RepID=UPI0013D1A65D|nr:hypothetical protein [Draconibacterium mangrovi]